MACFNVNADSAARLAWRIYASYGIQALSPNLQALVRVEAFHGESDLRSLVRETYAQMLVGTAEELTAVRHADANPGLFDDELVAHAFLGALENMMMRASWDTKYTKLDLMRNLLAILMTVRAAYSGRVDLTEEWAAVSDLAERLAAATPEALG